MSVVDAGLSATDRILELITCEIEELSDEVINYKNNLDRCEPFGKKYWLYHDKYQAAFIKRTYLVGLLARIK